MDPQQLPENQMGFLQDLFGATKKTPTMLGKKATDNTKREAQKKNKKKCFFALLLQMFEKKK